MQVRLEYNRRMRDAEMLENHIIQARLNSSTKEERALAERPRAGETYHQLALPPGSSSLIFPQILVVCWYIFVHYNTNILCYIMMISSRITLGMTYESDLSVNAIK